MTTDYNPFFNLDQWLEGQQEVRCIGCNKKPEEIQEYIDAAREEDMIPLEYVRRSEGTYNSRNGHFACTECYIKMGMPSSPKGWIAP